MLSTFARRTFLDQGVPDGKVSVVSLGVDPAAFRPSREVIDARLERIRRGAPLAVLYVGALSFQKGFADLIEMAQRVRDLSIRFRAVGPVTNEVRSLIDRLPVNLVCARKVPQSQLPAEYAQADVFVFPTIQDGFGMVLAQAAASGLPVLTTPHSAGADLVHEGRTGWILPARDPSAFAERLAWCAANREELCAVVEHAYSRFRPRSWDDVAADFTALCERTLAVAS